MESHNNDGVLRMMIGAVVSKLSGYRTSAALSHDFAKRILAEAQAPGKAADRGIKL